MYVLYRVFNISHNDQLEHDSIITQNNQIEMMLIIDSNIVTHMSTCITAVVPKGIISNGLLYDSFDFKEPLQIVNLSKCHGDEKKSFKYRPPDHPGVCVVIYCRGERERDRKREREREREERKRERERERREREREREERERERREREREIDRERRKNK